MIRSVLFLLLLVVISCKKEVKNIVKPTASKPQLDFPTATKDNTIPAYVAANPNDKPLQEPKSTYEETRVPSAQELRNQGESILSKRMSDKAEAIAALDVSKWNYDGEFLNGKFTSPDEIKGRWIDFSEKWRYTYGNGSGKKGSGRYHYDNDTKLLLMLDDIKSTKPIEFKIKIVNDALVLMGQSTYADGNYQAKLTREKVK